jgi:two-component system, chemotaxis family, chemotaxis protein CheY
MAKVMIAEDSEPNRRMFRELLLIGGHEIIAEAKDGVEAVDKFNQTKPDVLLLDVAMPKKDGLTALQEIIGQTPDARIIMITASEDLPTITKCMSMGAQAYLIKPFRSDDVLNAINMIFA